MIQKAEDTTPDPRVFSDSSTDAMRTAEASAPKYNITVKLIGTDSNAFSIIGNVGAAIRGAVGNHAANAYITEAMSCGSYDELLSYTMKTVNVT